MKKELIGFLICMLLIAVAVLPVVPGAVNNVGNTLKEQQIAVEEGSTSQGDEVDWWPMFRHDLSNSGYSTSYGPETNNVLWTFQADGLVDASPVVVDGRVYIGECMNNGRLYCLDANDGSEIWSYRPPMFYASIESTAVVVDGRVYVSATGGNFFPPWNLCEVYCINADNGNVIWTYTILEDTMIAPPAIADGKVYIGSWHDGMMFCLDADNGNEIWTYQTYGEHPGIVSAAAVVDGKVYFGSWEEKVHCLDANDGSVIWEYSPDGEVGSSPAVIDGKVYVGSRIGEFGDGGKMNCLYANNGTKIWEYETDHIVESSPAVAYGNVYFGSSDKKMYCLNADDGTKIWEYKTGDRVESSPAVAGGNVYIASYDGKMYCFNAYDGTKLWEYDIGSGFMWSSPAVAEGKVYIGGEDTYKVYCFGDIINHPPNIPTIDGPTSGNVGVSYPYTFVATDPEGDDIAEYIVRWGDAHVETITGPFTSGTPVTKEHTWDYQWTFTIRAKAIDIFGAESDWGTLKVTMPKNYNAQTQQSTPLSVQMMQRIPNIR